MECGSRKLSTEECAYCKHCPMLLPQQFHIQSQYKEGRARWSHRPGIWFPCIEHLLAEWHPAHKLYTCCTCNLRHTEVCSTDVLTESICRQLRHTGRHHSENRIHAQRSEARQVAIISWHPFSDIDSIWNYCVEHRAKLGATLLPLRVPLPHSSCSTGWWEVTRREASVEKESSSGIISFPAPLQSAINTFIWELAINWTSFTSSQ